MYKIQHIPIDGVKRQDVKIKPNTITIHSTANLKSTAQNERDNLARPDNFRKASFHLVADDKGVIECVPLNEKTLHAGNKTGNLTSISIEMVESGNRQKVLDNTVKLVAKLLYEMKWDVSNLRRHFDWSGKNCPRILNYNNWEGWRLFVDDVKKELSWIKKQEPSKWHVEDWEWGIKNKITDGTIPRDNITREQVMSMLHRYHKMTRG